MHLGFAGLFAVALLNVATPAVAKQQHFVAEANGQINFVMPSNNVGCIYTPVGGTATYYPTGGGPELTCDRVEPSYVNITLGPKGPAVLVKNPGEQSCCSDANIFSYGNSAQFDGFMCTSSTAGLACQTSDKRHGFTLARSRTLHY